ncbi:MAG: cobalamin biosynthesis protein [Gammaproteobacteria bacterium]|nr:cobalamin biosynthesis protein [Gammaproteobacteria bacterium]
MTRVTLGLGCDRNASLDTLQATVTQALARAALPQEAITEIATIDKKCDEQSILQLAKQHGWPLRFFSAEALAQVAVPSPSETVRKYMGTPSVAEAAALLAANTHMGDLLVEKHKYRGTDGKNATVSIAKRRNNE